MIMLNKYYNYNDNNSNSNSNNNDNDNNDNNDNDSLEALDTPKEALVQVSNTDKK